MTTPSPARTALCPVDGCPHEFDLTIKPVPVTALADVFGLGVLAAAHQHHGLVEHERELDRHFRTHTTIEFVRSLVKANQRLAASESTCEVLHEKAEKLARRLSPLPGDFVKGWIDEGGSAQGILLTNEEAAQETEIKDFPSCYAAVKAQPSGQVSVVMRESLRGVDL